MSKIRLWRHCENAEKKTSPEIGRLSLFDHASAKIVVADEVAAVGVTFVSSTRIADHPFVTTRGRHLHFRPVDMNPMNIAGRQPGISTMTFADRQPDRPTRIFRQHTADKPDVHDRDRPLQGHAVTIQISVVARDHQFEPHIERKIVADMIRHLEDDDPHLLDMIRRLEEEDPHLLNIDEETEVSSVAHHLHYPRDALVVEIARSQNLLRVVGAKTAVTVHLRVPVDAPLRHLL